MQSIQISVNTMFSKSVRFFMFLECASKSIEILLNLWSNPRHLVSGREREQKKAFTIPSVSERIKCPLKMIINDRHVTTRRRKTDLIFEKPDYASIRRCRCCCYCAAVVNESQRLWMSNHSTVKWCGVMAWIRSRKNAVISTVRCCIFSKSNSIQSHFNAIGLRDCRGIQDDFGPLLLKWLPQNCWCHPVKIDARPASQLGPN